MTCGAFDVMLFCFQSHWKNPEFPLARIKKIMRMDEEVKVNYVVLPSIPYMSSVTTASLAGQMISSEVPLMLSKAVEIFVTELTLRAWLHTEESKRRTVQVSHSFILSFSLYTFSHMSSSLQHNRIFIPSATLFLFCPCSPLSLFLLVRSPPPPTHLLPPAIFIPSATTLCFCP